MCEKEGDKVVDAHNMCWFHECVQGEYGLQLTPVRCALGSKISYNFVSGAFNPCTINFDDVIGESQRRHLIVALKVKLLMSLTPLTQATTAPEPRNRSTDLLPATTTPNARTEELLLTRRTGAGACVRPNGLATGVSYPYRTWRT